MKNIIIALLICLVTLSCSSTKLIFIDGKAYTFVEKMPEYPGGEKAMYEFISKNIRYPAKAVDANISGKVYVNFVIDKKGNVTNVNVIRGIGYGCDEEVIRVISLMPVWTPGKQKGRKVKVSFNIPINFNLKN